MVKGIPNPIKGRIDAPIKRSESGIKRIVSQNGKNAVTEYEVIKEGAVSTVRVFPITGRTHQIRVHLAHIGHPIVGDSLYGIKKDGERCRLHCQSVEFIHPETKQKLKITAPLPDCF